MPLLLAAVPLAVAGLVPFVPPAQTTPAAAAFEQELAPVETFDPEARARLMVQELPRQWSGTYLNFQTRASVPVTLTIASLTPLGQMIDLRGQMTVAGVSTPIQGNINAKSDQLDLLLLANTEAAGLEPGGEFQGLQGLSLFGWSSSRLTSPGGRLELTPLGRALKPSGGGGGSLR
ncbi:MAG: hypothetical protein RLZZ624_640 [Cyanobacteriota bacterium]|jgi:hypothetical protein